MMTTMAALLGGLPLALGTGVGSELRRPLGIAMVGGLIFSQMLTLYTTPVIYLAFETAWPGIRRAGRWRQMTAANADAMDVSKVPTALHELSTPFIHRRSAPRC